MAENQKGVITIQGCSTENQTLYSDSALLVLNETSLNSDNALLALNWRCRKSNITAISVLFGAFFFWGEGGGGGEVKCVRSYTPSPI